MNEQAAASPPPAAPATLARVGGWPTIVGLVLFIAVDISLLAKARLYPTQFVNGVVCTCGQPGWVALWGLALYGVFLTAAGLLILGVYRFRRMRSQARALRRPPAGHLPP